jgi:hypothetical protein
MTSDYDPEWDYQIDKKPSAEVVAAVRATLQRYAAVFSELDLDTPQVYYVRGLGPHLARYVSGTRDSPVIVLDAKGVIRTAKKYRVGLEDGVESTILHEVGHAYLDSVEAEVEDEEELVERFAKTAWRGFYDEAVALLKAAG